MLLELDDDVSRLPGIWLGPEKMRAPWDWTYPEWWIGIAAGTVLGGASAVAVGLLSAGMVGGPHSWAWGVVLGVLAFLPSFFVFMWLAVHRAHPHLGSDENVRWHLLWVAEAWMQWRWAHGPVDVAERRIRWAVTLVVIVAAPGPWWLRIPAAVAAARYSARYLVARFESTERYWRREGDRLARQTHNRPLTWGAPALDPKGKPR